MNIQEMIQNIEALHKESQERAIYHLNHLTKPISSLGRLEELAVQLAGISQDPFAQYKDKRVVIMAADHGVVAEGVSAFPQEVTPQMVQNFLNHGAAINVMTKTVGASVVCVDVGVASDISSFEGMIHKKVAFGTKNFAKEPAMTEQEVWQAIEVGIQVAKEQIEDGAKVLATGEMGIGNTTPSSAVLSVLANIEPINVVGAGTGLNQEQVKHKANVIKQAIELHKPNREDAVDVLQKVGGLELAALCGLCLGAAIMKTPIVIDGFISTVSALCAATISPNAKAYMIPSHHSVEPGHTNALQALGLQAYFPLNMRLGEGTGATITFPMIDMASNIMREMASFESAGVTNKE
ncbi:nicotinate-nucleotide--dimethylbenzimidazole phosphoribosyltransferase [Massilibacterium senegalense]|uniref:nicotinate-nucleotide--dimethylbenzimidazole phosphoribosyltransferase n=1 Tax=Massilibacterium senegalense TaxID=1632858 RepID=UPI00078439C5|nr:nicotinate-nucleotide--dimethylbenzimidazole phosphoribosyltransferase [Massilibacterium senegalense]